MVAVAVAAVVLQVATRTGARARRAKEMTAAMAQHRAVLGAAAAAASQLQDLTDQRPKVAPAEMAFHLNLSGGMMRFRLARLAPLAAVVAVVRITPATVLAAMAD